MENDDIVTTERGQIQLRKKQGAGQLATTLIARITPVGFQEGSYIFLCDFYVNWSQNLMPACRRMSSGCLQHLNEALSNSYRGVSSVSDSLLPRCVRTKSVKARDTAMRDLLLVERSHSLTPAHFPSKPDSNTKTSLSEITAISEDQRKNAAEASSSSSNATFALGPANSFQKSARIGKGAARVAEDTAEQAGTASKKQSAGSTYNAASVPLALAYIHTIALQTSKEAAKINVKEQDLFWKQRGQALRVDCLEKCLYHQWY